MKKVLIAVPSTFVMWSHTVTDLINLAVYSAGQVQIGYLNIQGALLPVSRDNCIKYAQAHHFDYILFVDSDMKFPADGLLRLLAHKKDIIGVNAAVKGEGKNVLTKNIDGVNLKHCHNIAKMSGIGMAFTLINMNIFQSMSLPYFYIDYSEDGTQHWGEDMSFTADAASLGFHVWCDLELSKQIEHIGAKAYKLEES